MLAWDQGLGLRQSGAGAAAGADILVTLVSILVATVADILVELQGPDAQHPLRGPWKGQEGRPPCLRVSVAQGHGAGPLTLQRQAGQAGAPLPLPLLEG